MELTKPRIEVEEGKFGETTAVKLCFKLTDIADGLKRNVTFSLEAVPITAEGKYVAVPHCFIVVTSYNQATHKLLLVILMARAVET